MSINESESWGRNSLFELPSVGEIPKGRNRSVIPEDLFFFLNVAVGWDWDGQLTNLGTSPLILFVEALHFFLPYLIPTRAMVLDSLKNKEVGRWIFCRFFRWRFGRSTEQQCFGLGTLWSFLCFRSGWRGGQGGGVVGVAPHIYPHKKGGYMVGNIARCWELPGMMG